MAAETLLGTRQSVRCAMLVFLTSQAPAAAADSVVILERRERKEAGREFHGSCSSEGQQA